MHRPQAFLPCAQRRMDRGRKLRSVARKPSGLRARPSVLRATLSGPAARRIRSRPGFGGLRPADFVWRACVRKPTSRYPAMHPNVSRRSSAAAQGRDELNRLRPRRESPALDDTARAPVAVWIARRLPEPDICGRTIGRDNELDFHPGPRRIAKLAGLVVYRLRRSACRMDQRQHIKRRALAPGSIPRALAYDDLVLARGAFDSGKRRDLPLGASLHRGRNRPTAGDVAPAIELRDDAGLALRDARLEIDRTDLVGQIPRHRLDLLRVRERASAEQQNRQDGFFH
ncbi:hypothetical protein SAMN04487939_105217 [Lysobacter sp. yr284]|nr:hypothetical protein SAMN04487939_105217 [Lysobacter sp. yr284]